MRKIQQEEEGAFIRNFPIDTISQVGKTQPVDTVLRELYGENVEFKTIFRQIYIYRFVNEEFALFCLTACYRGLNFVEDIEKYGNSDRQINDDEILSKLKIILKYFTDLKGNQNPVTAFQRNLTKIEREEEFFFSSIMGPKLTLESTRKMFKEQICRRFSNDECLNKLMIKRVQYLLGEINEIKKIKDWHSNLRSDEDIGYHYLYLLSREIVGDGYWVICSESFHEDLADTFTKSSESFQVGMLQECEPSLKQIPYSSQNTQKSSNNLTSKFQDNPNSFSLKFSNKSKTNENWQSCLMIFSLLAFFFFFVSVVFNQKFIENESSILAQMRIAISEFFKLVTHQNTNRK